jgi:hypothetical protein
VKIEILYVPGCINYHPAVDLVSSVLAAASFRAEVSGVLVHNEKEARALHFPGSPTIRVDGLDVEPQASRVFGLACRLYRNGNKVPSEEVVRRAISQAKRREECESQNAPPR